MISRVQYLVKEERKILKKIDSTHELGKKNSIVKEGKIEHLMLKLEHERREQKDLKNKYEGLKKEREENQSKKLKKAYE